MWTVCLRTALCVPAASDAPASPGWTPGSSGRHRGDTSPRLSAKGSEGLSKIADQEVGFFHGGEVTASVELGPAHDVVRRFGEPPDRQGDVAREDSDRRGYEACLLGLAQSGCSRGSSGRRACSIDTRRPHALAAWELIQGREAAGRERLVENAVVGTVVFESVLTTPSAPRRGASFRASVRISAGRSGTTLGCPWRGRGSMCRS